MQLILYQTRIILKNYYNMVAIDLSKQRALHADPKAIQQIILTGSLERDDGTIMFFNTEESKEPF